MRGLCIAVAIAFAGCTSPNPAYHVVADNPSPDDSTASSGGFDADGAKPPTVAPTPDVAHPVRPPVQTPDAASLPLDAAVRAPDAASLPLDTAVQAPDIANPPIDAAVPPPPATGFCPNDPNLVGCFRFENDLVDESPARQVATGTDIAYAVGRNGQALSVSTATRLRIAETPTLDFKRFTMEVWLYARSLPAAGTRMGILDNQDQYGLFVYPGGSIRCGAGPNQLFAPAGAIRVGEWIAVACSVDETFVTVRVGGILAASGPGQIVPTGGTLGLTIGGNTPQAGLVQPDPFNGLIDNLRIWSRVRSTSELCSSIGGCRP